MHIFIIFSLLDDIVVYHVYGLYTHVYVWFKEIKKKKKKKNDNNRIVRITGDNINSQLEFGLNLLKKNAIWNNFIILPHDIVCSSQ